MKHEEIFSSLKYIYSKFELDFKNFPKRPILFLGSQNCGKTCTRKFLDNHNFRWIEVEGERILESIGSDTYEIDVELHVNRFDKREKLEIFGDIIEVPIFKKNSDLENELNHAFLVKSILKKSPKGIRIVYIVSLDEINHSRGEGLKKVYQSLLSLYGSQEELEKEFKSFIILITKVQNSKFTSQESLRNFFKQRNLEILANRVFTFDLMDKPLKGGLYREQVKTLINQMSSKVFKSSFVMPLSPETEEILYLAFQKIKSEILQSLSSGLSITLLNEHYKDLMLLEQFEYPKLSSYIKDEKEYLSAALNSHNSSQVRRMCLENNFDIAKDYLNKIESLEVCSKTELNPNIESLLINVAREEKNQSRKNKFASFRKYLCVFCFSCALSSLISRISSLRIPLVNK